MTFSTTCSPLRRRRYHAKRRGAMACIAPDEHTSPDISYDDMVSDDTHVVLDSDQVAQLLERMEKSGRDFLSPEEEDDPNDFFTYVEQQIDDANQKKAPAEVSTPQPLKLPLKRDIYGDGDTESEPLNYFDDNNVQYMPSWLKEAYLAGEHVNLEAAAERISAKPQRQRLHDIVARKKATTDEMRAGDGIVDCTVQDAADDYGVPDEFVIDAMLAFGVPTPLTADSSIRDCMTTDELHELLHLITSFDAVDLADRYSDKTISELAEDYDITIKQIVDVCEKEGLYLCAGSSTRLSVVREDRVLDIILKGAALGQPYPPLLDGLVK